MRTLFFVVWAIALVAIVPAVSTGAAPGSAATAVPAAQGGTPPPQIYRVVTRPLCSELRSHIGPAIGMMLQNDTTIKKSPPLFKSYNMGALYGVDNSAAGGSQGSATSGDAGSGTMNASQNMAILGMENLIRPIANNIIAIQTMLDNPALTKGSGLADDDKRLQDMRAKLLKALAIQNASLDIISGFVDTQQMADLQHSGQEYIGAINKPDAQNTGMSTPTPNPLMYNPNYAGLSPNPYNMDLADIPGLTLGYNPVTRLLDALHWTIAETATRENDAAKAVMSSAAICASAAPGAPPASPSPSSSP